jgi:hemerythrin-like metal-binding protein
VQECRAHFAEEEQILETAGYPQLEGHAATHRSLLAAAEQMQARLARGEATATELFELIARDLIAGHILKEDRESLGAKLPLSA